MAGGVGTYFLAGWYSLLSKHFEEQFEFSAVRAGIYGGELNERVSMHVNLCGGVVWCGVCGMVWCVWRGV